MSVRSTRREETSKGFLLFCMNLVGVNLSPPLLFLASDFSSQAQCKHLEAQEPAGNKSGGNAGKHRARGRIINYTGHL